MKPVPFAQYLERKQLSPSPASPQPALPKPASWPPRETKAGGSEKPRNSPLLQRVESAKTDVKASVQRIEQGRLQAFEEGRDSARLELEDERGRLREALEVEIAKARAKWASEEGERLASAHRAALDSFEMRCAQAVANILRPFTTNLVIARVTDSLVENLEILFASRAQAQFEISGPADLLDALREKFASRDSAVVYKPDDGIDVRVVADDTIIESQLGAWMKALGALPRDMSDER